MTAHQNLTGEEALFKMLVSDFSIISNSFGTVKKLFHNEPLLVVTFYFYFIGNLSDERNTNEKKYHCFIVVNTYILVKINLNFIIFRLDFILFPEI